MKLTILKVLEIVLVIILLSIPVSLISLNSELIVADEIWNFQNVAKLLNGGKMYVDCNIIVTPIFYLIGYCFVKLITSTILGFRIYNIVIFVGLLLSIFVLFRTLKITKFKSFLYILLVILFVMPYISTGANYNVLAETIYILGAVLFLNRDRIKLYNFYQGLIIFLCIFTKQNIGLYYSIALVVSEIVVLKKESVRCIIKESIVAAICTFIAVFIMCVTGCFSGFLNYTVFGMGEFTTKNFSIQQTVEGVIVGYLTIAVCSYILGIIISKQDKDINYNIKVLSIFSIFLNFSLFPIANLYHTSLAILLNVIIFIYILEKLLFYKLENKVILSFIIVFVYMVINSFGITCGYRVSKNVKITDKENIYFSSNISQDLNKKIEEVTKYIKEKEKEGIDVICISSDGAIYMTYLHKNHGELDLCFRGNLGFNGADNVIKKIDNLKNTEILVNQSSYWQEIEELRSYVLENCEYIGTIEDLEIYKK